MIRPSKPEIREDRLLQGEPREVVAVAAAQQHRSLYIDGGRTIQAFLAAGVISELIITVIPVLLGDGRPLFGPLPADLKVRLVSSRAYPFGFVQNHYTLASDA